MSKNERKTESIVRKHFEQFEDQVLLEEQSSDNIKIKKLLSTASKSGMGGGYPEFIIQYRNNPDLIIVVECKADIAKHESKTRDNYKEFSVDGVLLYSSYLSKEFDVLSIAVSGETESSKKISHFLQLKGDKKAVEVFDDKLLTPNDYFSGYIKSPEKFRQDYEKLLAFSKDLNDQLHTLQIKEDLRALLISAILISLEDSAFKKSYKDYTDAKQLARFLIETTLNQFEKAKLENTKIENLKIVYQQITIVDSLVEDVNNIKGLIIDIDLNINDFIRTHKYFDVLGQLYIEFLRYANSDKGLGIVLTPPHITEFMAKLAEVNKSSVVYDSCTGTGGFLVTSMKLMVQDAKGDEEKISQIKSKQLIGVENKSHIFALACSNMFIHQDGKTNILNGSCFDEEIINKVKERRPTVGLLNPPYKSDKKKDIEELEFVLNNLECIEQGGKTVAIIPMQAALARNGKILEIKRKLLKQNTLEAVFSMPNELFINSKVGVVSCIMVFTAKRPHPENKKVFFGYFKDDGFLKRKNRGRIDVNNQWETIRENWLSSYINKENIPGFSVNKVINIDDEWCAEAYMETDYSLLVQNKFNESIRKFIAFKVLNQEVARLDETPFKKIELDLKVDTWSTFCITKIFEDISLGKPVHKDQLNIEIKGSFAYVTRTTENNGIELFVDNSDEYPVNKPFCLTIGAEGFEAFYQVNEFITGNKINIFRDSKLNIFNALFIKPILDLEMSKKFNYGRGATKDRLSTLEIKLPSKGDQPDWLFMEEYIKSLPYSSSL